MQPVLLSSCFLSSEADALETVTEALQSDFEPREVQCVKYAELAK